MRRARPAGMTPPCATAEPQRSGRSPSAGRNPAAHVGDAQAAAWPQGGRV